VVGFAREARAYDAPVAKTTMTVTFDEHVLRAVRAKAARTGKRDSEVVEQALRRDLGLDLVERRADAATLGEDEAVALATEAQHESRRRG